MDIVTLDVETYYDREYSLSRMTTEAYIRDKRFELIGISRQVNDDLPEWYSGENFAGFLAQHDYSRAGILCHNTPFDSGILAWKFGINPRMWFDTLSMARPFHASTVGLSLRALAKYYDLGSKGDEIYNVIGMQRADFTPESMKRYGEYGVQDSVLTRKLFKKLLPRVPMSELVLIDQIMRMWTQPQLVLGKQVLIGHYKDVCAKKANLIQTLDLPDKTEEEVKKMLMSNPQLADYLRGAGVVPPMKTSLATGKQTYAFSKTDLEFLALQDHPNEKVAHAVSARLGVKSTLEETRTKRMLGISLRGKLPVMLKFYGAHTGRLAGDDKMNLQNLTRGGNLRKAVEAPPGYMLVSCDSSQIEARILAYIAGQWDLIDAFREGRDVYSEFATKVYGFQINKSMKVERFVGKTSILGLGYGMGHPKFQSTLAIGNGGLSLDMPLGEALNIVNIYRSSNHRIKALWKTCQGVLASMLQGVSGEIHPLLPFNPEDGIVLPNGMPLKYTMLTQLDDGSLAYLNQAQQVQKAIRMKLMDESITTGDKFKWNYIYGGKVVENVVQALARIVVTEQMAAIGKRYLVALQVHDEIVVCVREEEAEEAAEFMIDVMSRPPTWAPDLPVACEAGIGPNYGEAK